MHSHFSCTGQKLHLQKAIPKVFKLLALAAWGCITKQILFYKQPKGPDGNSSGFKFTKPGCTGFEIRGTGWLCIMLTDTHTLFPLTHTHIHTNTPKLDTWSVDAGAFPKGPRSVHLTVSQLLMRASEWTSGEWRATQCLYFHSSTKFKHFSCATSLLTSYRPPSVIQWVPSQGLKSLLAWQNWFLS